MIDSPTERPSFRPIVDADGTIVAHEPTEHYLNNLASELLNRDATRVVTVQGVKDVVFSDGLTPVTDHDGVTVGVTPGDDEMAVTILFDPKHPAPALALAHRVAADEADLVESHPVGREPWRPTLADIVVEIDESLDDDDISGVLPFPYLDSVVIGNHLLVHAGDGVGGEGGYFRVTAERISAEQYETVAMLAERVQSGRDEHHERDEDAEDADEL